MNCPTCSQPLQMTEREGVEIDYCTRCRGIWLDRGELDKILERSRSGDPPYRRGDDDDDDDRRGNYRGEHGRYYPKKKESFLSRLLDFD